jgi:flagellar hook-length control protein FliK
VPQIAPPAQAKPQLSSATSAPSGASEPQSTSTAVQPGAKNTSESAPEPVRTAAPPIAPVPAEAAEGPREPTAVEPRPAEATLSTPTAETRTAQIVRGAPETVASLAAEIQRKLEGRNTRFEVALDPAGLGMVNVSIDIGADGRMSAQLAFERPEAAAELRGRSGELQRALEQAGFDLSRGGLSFNGEGAQGRSGGDAPRHQNARAQAFQDALLQAEAADTLPTQPLRLRDRGGINVRI